MWMLASFADLAAFACGRIGDSQILTQRAPRTQRVGRELASQFLSFDYETSSPNKPLEPTAAALPVWRWRGQFGVSGLRPVPTPGGRGSALALREGVCLRLESRWDSRGACGIAGMRMNERPTRSLQATPSGAGCDFLHHCSGAPELFR